MKLIPFETFGASKISNGKKQKHFNPWNKVKKSNGSQPGHFGSLKGICLQIVHFINRGKRFTYEQIDDLIVALQHSILSLQRKKQEMLNDKNFKLRKRR
ncbi:MAG: hypothetical protein AAB606_05250 [Patescibacteria group bacterium]